jgi:hypothetical protein
MAVEFYDRRGNETDGEGNQVIKSPTSAPGNRAFGETVIYKKKPQAAAAASPPPPPKKNPNKK